MTDKKLAAARANGTSAPARIASGIGPGVPASGAKALAPDKRQGRYLYLLFVLPLLLLFIVALLRGSG